MFIKVKIVVRKMYLEFHSFFSPTNTPGKLMRDIWRNVREATDANYIKIAKGNFIL